MKAKAQQAQMAAAMVSLKRAREASASSKILQTTAKKKSRPDATIKAEVVQPKAPSSKNKKAKMHGSVLKVEKDEKGPALKIEKDEKRTVLKIEKDELDMIASVEFEDDVAEQADEFEDVVVEQEDDEAEAVPEAVGLLVEPGAFPDSCRGYSVFGLWCVYLEYVLE